MDIISMAQQARPNPSGHSDFLRAQFTALSSCVKMMPSSASSFPRSSGRSSVTFLPNDVLIGVPSPEQLHFLTIAPVRTDPQEYPLQDEFSVESAGADRAFLNRDPSSLGGLPIDMMLAE